MRFLASCWSVLCVRQLNGEAGKKEPMRYSAKGASQKLVSLKQQ